jgi:hypothetical protein
MTTLAFDSLQFARRLKAVGVPQQQAEVQAELMAEAFGFYVHELVTKDYLDEVLRARFAEQDLRFEQRFLGIDRRLDGGDRRLDAIDARLDAIDARLGAIDARLDAMDARFDAMDARFDAMESDLKMMATSLDAMARRQLQFEGATANNFATVLQRFTQLEAGLIQGLADMRVQSADVRAQLRLQSVLIVGTWLLVGYPLLRELLMA